MFFFFFGGGCSHHLCCLVASCVLSGVLGEYIEGGLCRGGILSFSRGGAVVGSAMSFMQWQEVCHWLVGLIGSVFHV